MTSLEIATAAPCRQFAAVRRVTFLAATALTLVLGWQTASAEPIPQFYVFGDSSSDVGSEGFFRRPTNDGPMWSEAFGRRIGLTSTPGFTRTLDADFNLVTQEPAGGNNYAVNGATAVAYPGLSSFAEQVDAFASARGRFDRRDLVFTWFTRNDITTGAPLGVYDRDAYADAYLSQITRLRNLGARNLVAVGAEVNLLPEQFVLDRGAPSGSIDALRVETIATEAVLWPRLAAAGVYVLDLNRLAEDVRLDPGKYGFVSTTDSYQGRGASDGVPSQLRPDDGNVFTEDGHYTSAMQIVVSDFFLAQLRARDQFTNIMLQSGQAFRRDAQAVPDIVATGFTDRSSSGFQRTVGPWRIYGNIGVSADTQFSGGGTDVRLSTAAATAAVGADYAIDRKWLVGARAAFAESRGAFAENTGRVSRQSALLTAYAAAQISPDLRIHAAGHFGIADFSEIQRRATLGSAVERVTGKTSGNYFGAEIGAWYDLRIVEGWKAAVRGTLAYEHTGLDAYREAASVLALAYGSSSTSSLLGTIGIRIARDAPDGTIKPFLDVAYTRDFQSKDITVNVGPTGATIVPYRSERPYRNALSITGGASYELPQNLSVSGSLHYSRVDDKKRFDSVSGTIRLRKVF